jgi:DNA topoisomerase III
MTRVSTGGSTVNLCQAAAPVGGRLGQRRARTNGNQGSNAGEAKPKSRRLPKAKRPPPKRNNDQEPAVGRRPERSASARPTPPTSRMVAFAQRLAKEKKAKLPSGYDKDFNICRRFLDQHLGR